MFWVLVCRIQGKADLPSGILEQGSTYTYLGHSPFHADSAALVLNSRTGLVFPQYHVVIYHNFSTVPSLRTGTVPSNWKDLVDNIREKSADGFYDITKTLFESDSSPAPHAPPSAESDILGSQDAGPTVVETDTTAVNADTDGTSSIPDHNPTLVTQDDTVDEPTHHDTNKYVSFEEGAQMPPVLNLQTAGLRRSPRIATSSRGHGTSASLSQNVFTSLL